MAALVDASSPIRWSGTPADGVDITSASFTAPADALLVVCASLDGNSGAGAIVATCSDSGGLTWTTKVSRENNETVAGGASFIFTARTTSAVARTVGVRRTSDGGTNRISAKCYVVTGADVDGTPVDSVGASNEGGSATNNLDTTNVTPGATGLLFVAECDWSALGYTASSNLTQDTAIYAGAISAFSGYRTCASGVGVSGNIDSDTGTPQHKWCQIVVREAPGAAPYVAGRGFAVQQRMG